MKRVSRDNVFYAFSAELSPVMEVEPGEEILVETHDSRTSTITSASETYKLPDTSKINPATGPLFVRGAQPGDTLAVEILAVEAARPWGLMVVRPGAGALGDRIREGQINIVPIEEGKARLTAKVRLELRPMVGVVGVAPKEGAIDTFTPDHHGGNMDCKLIRPGARVYLPVYVPGALLGLGDVHALMGDGEVVICGVEVPAEVTVRVEVLKEAKLPLPFLENEEIVAAIYSARTLDEAASGAVHRMAEFIVQVTGLSLPEAGWLMSASGDLRICQVVDPKKTCRMEFPKHILAAYGFSMRELR